MFSSFGFHVPASEACLVISDCGLFVDHEFDICYMSGYMSVFYCLKGCWVLFWWAVKSFAVPFNPFEDISDEANLSSMFLGLV